MGQKVNPISFRLGIVENWRSNWFAGKKDFVTFLKEDVLIREFIEKAYPKATVSKVEIEKFSDRIRVRLHTPRPGVVLGRKGQEINKIRDQLYEALKKQINIDVVEIPTPGLDAKYVGDSIVLQLEKRMPHRYAIKKAIQLALQSGAKGIKVRISGRIGGAEISRSEQYLQGSVPLHTLRAHIDYATSTAITKSGTVGLKVWIYLGEVFERDRAMAAAQPQQKRQSGHSHQN